MTFEVEFNDGDWEIIQQYMKDRNMTIDELARRALLEWIFPYDCDLADYEMLVEDYKKNPTPEKYEKMRRMVLFKENTFEAEVEGDKNDS